jgi:hypothetical protein
MHRLWRSLASNSHNPTTTTTQRQQHSRKSDRRAIFAARIRKKYRKSNEYQISNGVTVRATARETVSVSVPVLVVVSVAAAATTDSYKADSRTQQSPAFAHRCNLFHLPPAWYEHIALYEAVHNLAAPAEVNDKGRDLKV